MEFVDGMDIHEYLNFHGGTLEQTHAMAINAHVLDALDCAHSDGIVRRPAPRETATASAR
jgi:serine/threonine protein kinase